MTYERYERYSTVMGKKGLKVPKYEIFNIGFYTNKAVLVGSLGTGKN
jgi:hypothetical protein